MTALRWILPATSLACVVAVVLWDAQRGVGPGALHPLHAARPELQGLGGCPRCHAVGAAATVAAAGCTACHAPVARQQQEHRGVHGSLGADLAGACGTCHREHHGDGSRLLDDSAFARAGIADVRRYDHRHVPGYPLGGRHAELACEQCHDRKHADPARGGRWLGLETACASCHADVHKGAFGGDCAHCHGQRQPFAQPEHFDHSAFLLRDAHRGVACVRCHAEGTPRAVAALELRPQPARRCGDCHENPHVPAGGRPPASFSIRDSADCARCHDSRSFAGTRIPPAEHARVFELRGVHAEVECDACHGAAHKQPRWRARTPAPGECAACHESPHAPALLAAANRAARTGGEGCGDCHRDEQEDFHAGTIRAPLHELAGFPLGPPHAGVACGKCHGRAGQPWRQRFPGRAPGDCRACHQDPHGGQFDHDPRHAQCTACHLATAFSPPAFDVAAHAATAFPLHGLHQAVACVSCHDRVVGKVRQFAHPRHECSACHRDPHGGRFDQPGLPAAVAGARGCARCHDENGFAAEQLRRFDHALWTGYALGGAHARIECVACHRRTPRSPATGRTFGTAAGRTCADCHRDVHLGQFADKGRTDCARCHRDTAFAELAFDHQRDSRFALDARHARVACSGCHPQVGTPAGPVVRYKPLGTECKDCHRPAGGQGARR